MPMWIIQNEKLPFITLNSVQDPLRWDVGLMYKVRLQNTFMHIATNGIVASHRATLRVLDDASMGWKEATCKGTRTELCKHDESLVFFDMNESTIPYEHTSELSRKYMSPVCSSSLFGRLQTSATRRYSVSVCDIVHGNVHFVLSSTDGHSRMLFKQDSTSDWQVVFLALTAIYAVTMLCIHASELIQRETKKPGQTYTSNKRRERVMLGTHVVLAIVLVEMCVSHFSFLVTEDDVRLTSCLCVFVLLDVAFVVLHRTTEYRANDDNGKQVNGMVIFLLLITMRLNSSFQNVFVVSLTILFGIRMWCKVLQTAYVNIHRNLSFNSLIPNLSVSLDVIVFYFIVSIALSEQCENEFETQLISAMVTFVSFNVGLLLAVRIQMQK